MMNADHLRIDKALWAMTHLLDAVHEHLNRGELAYGLGEHYEDAQRNLVRATTIVALYTCIHLLRRNGVDRIGIKSRLNTRLRESSEELMPLVDKFFDIAIALLQEPVHKANVILAAYELVEELTGTETKEAKP
jgi:hypothetical protein